MPRPNALPCRRAAPRLAGTLALALAALLGHSGALAGPEQAGTDPITQWLADHAGDGSLIGRVRDRAADLVLTALNFVGVPYRRGGQSGEGFDCSGFTRYIFEHSIGLMLPRRSDEQARAPGLQSVKRDELQPGDLVFFDTLRRSFSHVGIYIGEGKFIHAPRSGAAVRIEDMDSAYWVRRYDGARRADIAGAAPAPAPARP